MSPHHNLITTLRTLGRAQMTREHLPEVATLAAHAARRGEIIEDDAMRLYAEYRSASVGGDPIDTAAPTSKANASKLRQIIKAADPELLRRVTAIRDKLKFQHPVVPLYHGMIEACRLKLNTGRKPTDGQIKALLIKQR